MEPVDVPTGSALLRRSIDLFVEKLGFPEVRDLFRSLKLDDLEQLEKLIANMRSVNCKIVDVEEHSTYVQFENDWLDGVRDAIYEAQVLLEEVQYEAERSLLLDAGSKTNKDKVPKFFSSLSPFRKQKDGPSYSMPKDEEMAKKFIQITSERFQRLVETPHGRRLERNEQKASRSRRQYHLPPDDDVYDMDEDKQAIMDLLQSNQYMVLQVIPIVGMCCVGKTKLAKFVCDDHEVRKCFDPIVWVHVYPEFDVHEIVKDILVRVSSLSSDSTKDANYLSSELRKELTDKKLLLVLDEVLSPDQPDPWNLLFESLKCVAKGSKIIITTQDQGIQNRSIQQSILSFRVSQPYHLSGIRDDNCWALFSKQAFESCPGVWDPELKYKSDSREYERRFRSDVLRTCGGLPRAAVALGRHLRYEGVEGWENLLMNGVKYPKIRRLLRSLENNYNHLPSYLKLCFAFCAIIPNNYLFTMEELILLWIAAGMVRPDRNKDIKEVGCEYFEELASRSFFQRVTDGSAPYVIPSFSMHCLVRAFARFLSEEYAASLGDGCSWQISYKTRHLSVACTRYGDLMDCEGINEVQNLRTFFSISKERIGGDFDNKEFNDLLATFKHLRALYLCNVFELPDSIGNFKYLSYLNISGASIKRLPESVCTLYCLQVLILCQCRDLVELPSNLTRLIRLHYVDIEDTSLQKMPPHMGKLTRLRILSDFFVGKQNGSSIKELGELNHLEGRLRIWNLQNVDDVGDAVIASIKEKENLKSLELRWSADAVDSLQAQGMLEQLEPHQNVRFLAIHGYGGMKFANWVGHRSFSHIFDLRLSECRHCSSLPPLGQLLNLKKLSIDSFYGVEVVDSEFYGLAPHAPFPFLESLTFERMPQWREWRLPEGSFSGLQMLCIRKCPRLKSSLEKLLQKVGKILLRDDFHLIQLDKLHSSFHSLTIDSTHSLDSILKQVKQLGCSPSLLLKIEITGVSMQHFPLEKFNKLQQLRIRRCRNLETLGALEQPCSNLRSSNPSMICECPQVEELILECCPKLKSICCSFPSLVNISITYCDELESFSGLGSSSKLLSILIYGCYKLFADLKQHDLRGLSSVSSFVFGGFEAVEYFPMEDMLLPSKLKSLVIRDLPYLKSLNFEGLQHLVCLEELKIENCAWYQPDWRKISDICKIIIDGKPLINTEEI